MAENLRNLIVNERFRLYPGAGLLKLESGKTEDFVDEISKLIVEEKAGGQQYRINHQPDCHDDRTIACGLGALFAVRQMRGPGFVSFGVNEPPKRSKVAEAERNFLTE